MPSAITRLLTPKSHIFTKPDHTYNLKPPKIDTFLNTQTERPTNFDAKTAIFTLLKPPFRRCLFQKTHFLVNQSFHPLIPPLL